MRYEKSCGAVVYTVRDGTFLYLLIRNRSGHIGFPKGHVELGEDERESLGELSEAAAWLSEALTELRGEITEGLTCAGDCRDALFALEEEFPELRYDRKRANEILTEWMHSFKGGDAAK